MYWSAESKVLIQGILEPTALKYTALMKAYGTNIVAGISPGNSERTFEDIPIFDLVEQAISKVGTIDITLIFVEPYRVLDAALEAIAAGIEQIAIVTAGVPPLDTIHLLKKIERSEILILGPGSGGLIVPGEIALGSLEPQFYQTGKIGIISRTKQLNYEVALSLAKVNCGVSIAVSVGKESIVGSSVERWLTILDRDDRTEAIVLIGQSNSSAEIGVARYISSEINKPVVVYMAGLHAPIERAFQDAPSIIANQLSYSVPVTNSEQEILAAFKEANLKLVRTPGEVGAVISKLTSNS
jgi:succinyl-CoA synthetase alpha subunit